ncbi:NUDIX hydrolase [Xylariales sp. AK1849]|nr:NUDIX hydrolase [Xylariales sp. AK1849]
MSADTYVTCATCGKREFGRYGGAGLLIVRRDSITHQPSHIIMQLRAKGTQHAGTWGTPGGARHADETAEQAAAREAREECGIQAHQFRIRSQYVWNHGHGSWTYTTVIADLVDEKFVPKRVGRESDAMEWVAIEDVEDRTLHPAFGQSWDELRRSIPNPIFIGG